MIMRDYEVRFQRFIDEYLHPVEVMTITTYWAEPEKVRRQAFATIAARLIEEKKNDTNGFYISMIRKIKQELV
jgi:hypothetical protein